VGCRPKTANDQPLGSQVTATSHGNQSLDKRAKLLGFGWCCFNFAVLDQSTCHIAHQRTAVSRVAIELTAGFEVSHDSSGSYLRDQRD
jgi:hypothetical protein